MKKRDNCETILPFSCCPLVFHWKLLRRTPFPKIGSDKLGPWRKCKQQRQTSAATSPAAMPLQRPSHQPEHQFLEEDKRATTNVQKMIWSFSSFFSLLKSPNLKRSIEGNFLKKTWESKSWFSGRGWGQQLFTFQSPAVHWMARTSSLNCLSCRNPYQTLHPLNCHPPFHWNPFFHWKVLRRIPFPKTGSEKVWKSVRKCRNDFAL